MRIEKQMQKQAKDDGNASDIAAREFADAVFEALGRMEEHQPVEGQAATEAERLAATLTFLRTLTLECTRQIRSYPAAMQSNRDRERVRLLIQASIMLRDITSKRRHPVHKFFRGSAKYLRSRQPTSQDVTRECILIAAVNALVQVGTQQEMKSAAAIQLLKSQPRIGEHMPSEEAFTKIFSRREIDIEYVERVNDNMEMMGWGGESTTDSILAWTEMALNSQESPLDLAAATTVKQYGMVRHAQDGSAVLMKPQPSPLPLLPSQRVALALKAKI